MSPRNCFIAEWIAAQHVDEFGEWEPDMDEYRMQDCATLEEAKRVSVERGKAANVVEWARVSEMQFDPDLGIPARSAAAWNTVRIWSGDWQGNWDEVR